jgi:hypothetical protein
MFGWVMTALVLVVCPVLCFQLCVSCSLQNEVSCGSMPGVRIAACLGRNNRWLSSNNLPVIECCGYSEQTLQASKEPHHSSRVPKFVHVAMSRHGPLWGRATLGLLIKQVVAPFLQTTSALTLYPEDHSWFLQNLTCKEYGCFQAFILEPEYIH